MTTFKKATTLLGKSSDQTLGVSLCLSERSLSSRTPQRTVPGNDSPTKRTIHNTQPAWAQPRRGSKHASLGPTNHRSRGQEIRSGASAGSMQRTRRLSGKAYWPPGHACMMTYRKKVPPALTPAAVVIMIRPHHRRAFLRHIAHAGSAAFFAPAIPWLGDRRERGDRRQEPAESSRRHHGIHLPQPRPRHSGEFPEALLV